MAILFKSVDRYSTKKWPTDVKNVNNLFKLFLSVFIKGSLWAKIKWLAVMWEPAQVVNDTTGRSRVHY